ncbi:MAG: glycosyl hydrolase 53 family protein [Bacteroidales bacterium]|nr:glycosyl hydrolase 53 family protein [Bacteroidales bacterium]
MKFFRSLGVLLTSALILTSCNGKVDPNSGANGQGGEQPGQEETRTVVFAKGADLGWITEMEAKGYKFYSRQGVETECTALMKSLGLNSVRYRVWVNPANGYNNAADVLAKCRRAQALGMQILIDFHYSDTWADPGKQIIPAAWQGYSAAQIASAVTEHTRSVLQTLKDARIDVTWVQVGNEVTPGMLLHTGTEGNVKEAAATISGKVSGSSVNHFVEYFNAGAAAVKSVYPDASVILHLDNGWKLETLTWFYDLVGSKGAKYDMIGLSLYPSYWEGSGYPDWRTKTEACVKNLSTLHARYDKPLMLVEFGMPASEPAAAKAALQYILEGTRSYDWFKGIFWWEPESEQSRNGYAYGAFSGGSPTAALDPFAN